ncbi:MAG: hypothetical protein AAFN77_16500 [Planctomycetota bacterium]
MNIRLNDKAKLLSQRAINTLHLKARTTFQRFRENVRGIEVGVFDVNGPRGGIDKQCRILVKLKRMKDIAVVATAASISQAIGGAVHRAARSVDKLVSRKANRLSSR